MARPGPLPAAVLDAAAHALHGQIAAADELSGGYAPNRLRRLRLRDGRHAILKAADAALDAGAWAQRLRREARAYRELPVLAPWRPACFGAFDAGGWSALLIEDLTGAARVPPWTDAALAACASGLAAMHAATLGGTRPEWLGSPVDGATFFADVRARGRAIGALPADWDSAEWWDWLDETADRAEAALGALAARAPRCVVHFDVRADNLFLRDGRLVLVDWPVVSWLPPSLDSVPWAIAVEVEGGPAAEAVHERYLARRALDRAEIAGALAYVAGYVVTMLQQATLPPHVRELHLAFLRPSLRWLASTLDLRAPPVE